MVYLCSMNTRKDKEKGKRVQLNKQLERVNTIREEHPKHEVARKMGDFFIDVAKLVIGGVILAGLMKQDIDYWPLAIAGAIAVVIFLLFGTYLINYSSKQVNKNSLYHAVSRTVFLDNNFQSFPRIGSNNNYWMKLLLIIGNYCPKKAACGHT